MKNVKQVHNYFLLIFGFCLKLQFSTVNPGYGFVSQKQTFGICQTGQIPFLLTKWQHEST